MLSGGLGTKRYSLKIARTVLFHVFSVRRTLIEVREGGMPSICCRSASARLPINYNATSPHSTSTNLHTTCLHENQIQCNSLSKETVAFHLGMASIAQIGTELGFGGRAHVFEATTTDANLIALKVVCIMFCSLPFRYHCIE